MWTCRRLKVGFRPRRCTLARVVADIVKRQSACCALRPVPCGALSCPNMRLGPAIFAGDRPWCELWAKECEMAETAFPSSLHASRIDSDTVAAGAEAAAHNITKIWIKPAK